MKTWAGHNPRDFRECDSVPEGRQDVATGESPWYAMKKRQKSRRDDRNCVSVVSCRPFRTKNHRCFSDHGLTPVATTCRHIRGSNAGLIHSPVLQHRRYALVPRDSRFSSPRPVSRACGLVRVARNSCEDRLLRARCTPECVESAAES